MTDAEAAIKIDTFTKSVNAKVKQKGRSQGRLDAERDNLKRAGYDTVEAARDFVADSLEELQKDYAEFVEDVEAFENEYAQYLS